MNFLACLGLVALASASIALHPKHGKKRKPPKLTGPKGELLLDGEEVFCTQLDDEERPACKQTWHSALTMTCGPTCHSYDAQQQVDQLQHFASYYAEDCDLQGETSCLAACVSVQLLGDDSFNAASSKGFVDSLTNAFGNSAESDTATWLNLSDPVLVAGQNASEIGVNATRNASKLLHAFWSGLCGGEKLSAQAEQLCPEKFKDPGRNIHFSYLDGPSTSFLQKSAPSKLDSYLGPIRALSQTSTEHSAEESSDSGSSSFMRTSALRRASRSGTASGVEISSIQRWLEAAALRQSQRSALCQGPYPQYRPYRAGSVPDYGYVKPAPLDIPPAAPPTRPPPPGPVIPDLPEVPVMGIADLPTLGPPGHTGHGLPAFTLSPAQQKLNNYLAGTQVR